MSVYLAHSLSIPRYLSVSIYLSISLSHTSSICHRFGLNVTSSNHARCVRLMRQLPESFEPRQVSWKIKKKATFNGITRNFLFESTDFSGFFFCVSRSRQANSSLLITPPELSREDSAEGLAKRTFSFPFVRSFRVKGRILLYHSGKSLPRYEGYSSGERGPLPLPASGWKFLHVLFSTDFVCFHFFHFSDRVRFACLV